MNLANIETILRIILIALKIAIFVEYVQSKNHKKNRSNHRKDER